MLKLKLKPTGSFGEQEVQCYNVSVSPDLSHISGRTSNYNELLDGENVKVINNKNNRVSLCKVDTENVKVQGRVVFDITLPINTVTKSLLLPTTSEYKLSVVTKNYVEYNGVYYYEDNNKSFIINGKKYTVNNSASTITISTFAYIEDGYVDINGKKYIADFRGGSGMPDIKETMHSSPLEKEMPVDDDGRIIFKGVKMTNKKFWKRETKFNIWKDENTELSVDTVLYGGYEHYIDYNGERYYFKQLYSGTTYSGYGVEIDNNYYSAITRSIYDGDENVGYIDEPFEGSVIEIDGEYIDIYDSIVSHANGGRFLFVVTKSESLDIKTDDIIIAKSSGSIPSKLIVQSDFNGGEERKYVLYNGKRYDVLPDRYKYIKAYDNEYRLFDDYEPFYSIINGNVVYFTIDGNKATPTNKIYYLSGITDSGNKLIEYGITKTPYTVDSSDAIDIEGTLYRVFVDENGNQYISINEDISFRLRVTEKNGSSTYVCYPDVEAYETDDNDDIARMQRYVCDMVVLNNDNFSFQLLNDVFGEKKIYPDTYLYEAVMSTKPFCTSDILNLSILKVNTYANFKIPMVNNTLSNVLKDDITKKDYTKIVTGNSNNEIVDMEKDIYYPVYKVEEKLYKPITNIRFNLHFRTRQLDNWKVIETYKENTGEEYSDTSNWVITDYKYYKEALEGITGGANKTLQNASDLIGFMNFTTADAENVSKALSKSFLRLSFFSTDNPQTQVLLATSTIFMDTNSLCDKAFRFKNRGDLTSFIMVKLYQNSRGTYESKSITDDSEHGYKFNETEEMRLSSRINVYDKYSSTGSSEGFYFYMYREYANNLRPTRMYMKVDFNHAGIGKSISFMLPRKFENPEKPDGEPLYVHNGTDLGKLKEGFTLKDIYKQTYIPIDAIYDEASNRYVYFLPNSLRENSELGVNDDIMEFNLFEVKFKDESKVEE